MSVPSGTPNAGHWVSMADFASEAEKEERRKWPPLPIDPVLDGPGEHPGRYIERMLYANRVRLMEAARRANVSHPYLSNVIAGRQRVGVALAVQLNAGLQFLHARTLLMKQVDHDLAREYGRRRKEAVQADGREGA